MVREGRQLGCVSPTWNTLQRHGWNHGMPRQAQIEQDICLPGRLCDEAEENGSETPFANAMESRAVKWFRGQCTRQDASKKVGQP